MKYLLSMGSRLRTIYSSRVNKGLKFQESNYEGRYLKEVAGFNSQIVVSNNQDEHAGLNSKAYNADKNSLSFYNKFQVKKC